MRALLRSVALCAVVATLVSPAALAAPRSAPSHALEVVLDRAWSFLDALSACFWPRAEKHGSLMDPDGGPGSGRSPGDINTPPENTDHGSLMDPNG